MKASKTSVYAIDAMRTLSILAVILIHTSSRALEYYHFDLIGHPFTLFLNQITRFAVPLFFLISGFVLELNFHLNESYWHYLKKRVNKIILPYVFWSLIYYYLVYANHTDSFLKALLTGSASYQLYFIPSLIIFYLAFPILHKLFKFVSNKWVIILFGVIQLFILYRDYQVRHLSVNFPVAVALFNYYVFILGMIAAKNYQKILLVVSKFRYLISAGLMTLIVYIFWQGKTLYYKTYDIGSFYSQWRPSILLYTLIFGAVSFYFFEKTHFGEKLLKGISKLSFFVFFVHVIILEEVWKLVGQNWNKWLDIPFFIIVSVVSFSVAYLIHHILARKVSIVSKITG